MNCVRCHKDVDTRQIDGIRVCDACIQLIVKEWDVKFEEVYAEM